MKKTMMMMAVLMGVMLVASTVDAGYVVYKTKNMPNAYVAGSTKAVKSTVETYTIVQTGAAGVFTIAEAPYRVIIFKDKAVGKGSFYIAEKAGTAVPAAVQAKYAPYWGSWDTAGVANLGTTFRAIYDTNGTSGQGVLIPGGNGEVYVGAVKDGLAKKLSGSLVYTTPNVGGIGAVSVDTKGSFTYDKKVTEALAGALTMPAAVAALQTYLETKKYTPATW